MRGTASWLADRVRLIAGAPYLAFFCRKWPDPWRHREYVFGAGQLGVENYALGRMDFLSSASTTIYGTYMFDTSHSTTPDAYNNRTVGDQGRHQSSR